jgi:hypothetical protein
LPTEPAASAHPRRTGGSCSGFGIAAVLLLSVAFSSAALLASAGAGREENPHAAAHGERPEGEEAGQRPQPVGLFRRLRDMPPTEQRRFMANNPQFLRLPPGRQQLIRERLRDWNDMTPQEKERVREREEILEGLSPAQRQEARNIFPQWRELTPLRRQAVMEAFRHLRDLPAGERRSFLDSQPVRERFSPHEREILEGLNKLLPASRSKQEDAPDE